MGLSFGSTNTSSNANASTTPNYSSLQQSLQTRMNQYNASRGFGQSGQSGQTNLQTNLGRASALAGNTEAAAGQQLNLGSTYLSDALQLALASPGSTSTGTTTGSSSGYAVGAAGGVGSNGWAVV